VGLVAMQMAASLAALQWGWYWSLAPLGTVALAVCLLAPRFGIYIAVALLYLRLSLPIRNGVYPVDIAVLLILAGVLIVRMAEGPSLFVHSPVNRVIGIMLAIFAIGVPGAYHFTGAVINWLRHVQILMFFLAALTLLTVRDVRRILLLMLVGTSMMAVVNVLRFIATAGTDRVIGPMGAFFPLFLSLAICHTAVHALTAEHRRHVAGWALLLLILIFAQIASLARAGWLQATISLAVMTVIIWRMDWPTHIKVKRRYLLVAGALGAIIIFAIASRPTMFSYAARRISSVLSGESTSMSIRYYLWMTGLKVFLSSPIMGIGLGQISHLHEYLSFWRFHPFAGVSRGLGAHNDCITYLAEVGLVGTTAILWYFVTVLRLGHETLKRCVTLEDRRMVLTLLVAAWGIVLTYFYGAHQFYSISGLTISLYFAMLVRCWYEWAYRADQSLDLRST
jgi:O-antigen ligase